MIDFSKIPSPCYVLEESRLIKNMEIFKQVQDRTGAKIICALKGYAMFSTFPLMRQYLPGCTASSLFEAKLGKEEFGGELHLCCPIYYAHEIDEMLDLAEHITFNSFGQWEKFKHKVLNHHKKISAAIRINPEFAQVTVDMYNPCVPGSRLGVRMEEFGDDLPEGIEGIHFHSLCQSNSDSLVKTLEQIELRFAKQLHKAKWLNVGGGHHITREDYDIDLLCQTIIAIKEKYQIDVIIEPGEAMGWQTGYLLSTVQDVFDSKGIKVAMLDVSIAAHMPDCLEMPYKAKVLGAWEPTKADANVYRMGGTTCLAGDFMGDYAFEKPLKEGDLVIFDDMIHYTMVKTTMFNGINLPSIGIWKQDNTFQLVKTFDYQDYKSRLS